MAAIRSGQCDAAIVGGVNLTLKPQTSLQFQRLGMLSPDGMCKSFDAAGKDFYVCFWGGGNSQYYWIMI